MLYIFIVSIRLADNSDSGTQANLRPCSSYCPWRAVTDASRTFSERYLALAKVNLVILVCKGFSCCVCCAYCKQLHI